MERGSARSRPTPFVFASHGPGGFEKLGAALSPRRRGMPSLTGCSHGTFLVNQGCRNTPSPLNTGAWSKLAKRPSPSPTPLGRSVRKKEAASLRRPLIIWSPAHPFFTPSPHGGIKHSPQNMCTQGPRLGGRSNCLECCSLATLLQNEAGTGSAKRKRSPEPNKASREETERPPRGGLSGCWARVIVWTCDRAGGLQKSSADFCAALRGVPYLLGAVTGLLVKCVQL
jgi:hypothetical protein